MRFSYQAEKLSLARRELMLPHSRGEAESIAMAFHNCMLAFHQFDADALDDSARGWYSKITEFMNTDGIEDPAGRGTHLIKAEGFTTDQKIELSKCVDELAHWFDRHFWESSK